MSKNLAAVGGNWGASPMYDSSSDDDNIAFIYAGDLEEFATEGAH